MQNEYVIGLIVISHLAGGEIGTFMIILYKKMGIHSQIMLIRNGPRGCAEVSALYSRTLVMQNGYAIGLIVLNHLAGGEIGTFVINLQNTVII